MQYVDTFFIGLALAVPFAFGLLIVPALHYFRWLKIIQDDKDNINGAA